MNLPESHPIVGLLTPARRYLPGPDVGFKEFHTPNLIGQCRVDGDRIDFLNVLSAPQYRGHFRRFQRRLREHYKFIRMWAVDAAEDPAVFRAILAHYGFRIGHDADKFGVIQEVWDYENEKRN